MGHFKNGLPTTCSAHTLSQRDVQDIVDTFLTYMIATNTDIMDIAFHFTEAQNLLSKDPYWFTQLVVVYTILSNDKMRYKREDDF